MAHGVTLFRATDTHIYIYAHTHTRAAGGHRRNGVRRSRETDPIARGNVEYANVLIARQSLRKRVSQEWRFFANNPFSRDAQHRTTNDRRSSCVPSSRRERSASTRRDAIPHDRTRTRTRRDSHARLTAVNWASSRALPIGALLAADTGINGGVFNRSSRFDSIPLSHNQHSTKGEPSGIKP